ncbi:MAG: 4-hydroxythreonine-4-phosphate dehydrogenase PdxA [Elusimicrobiota bacterium]
MKLIKPVAAITIGDPSGVGPEVVVKALQKLKNWPYFTPLVIGDRNVLKRYGWTASSSGLIELDNQNKLSFLPGKPSVPGGKRSFRYVTRAVELIAQNEAQVLINAPIAKESWHQAGYFYSGHTELLAELSKSPPPEMLMVGVLPQGRQLRSLLVTRHLPLKNIPANLSIAKIVQAIKLADLSLKKYFRLPQPSIGVCSLNPHAGEGGVLGREEKEIIVPAVKELKKAGLDVFGPYPADKVFWEAGQGKYDLAAAMYHDQAMIPLKLLAYHSAVNITLGLPFIRTSPGHGTAFDIAGKNLANPQAMVEAIKLAVEMYRHQ